MRARRILKIDSSIINSVQEKGGFIYLEIRGVRIGNYLPESSNDWFEDDIEAFTNPNKFVDIKRKIEDECKIGFRGLLHYSPKHKENNHDRLVEHMMNLITVPKPLEDIVREIFIVEKDFETRRTSLFLYLSNENFGRRDLRVITMKCDTKVKLDCYHLEVGPLYK